MTGKETENEMNGSLSLHCGVIVCLQFDDFAVLTSPKGSLPVRGEAQAGDL